MIALVSKVKSVYRILYTDTVTSQSKSSKGCKIIIYSVQIHLLWSVDV